MNRIAERQFRFTAELVRIAKAAYYAVHIPAKISKALGKRGPIPVAARINDIANFTASLSPAGGGRHFLRINARNRALAAAELGDRVRVAITVLSELPKVEIPEDLKLALRSEGVLEHFQSFAPGKQLHIIDWITKSARAETREKRIQFTVQITHERRERRRAASAIPQE
jgi:hypothetical protein